MPIPTCLWDGSSTWGTTGFSFPRGVLSFAELVGLARKIYDRPKFSEAPFSSSIFYDCWPIYDSASRLQIRSGLHGEYNNTHHAVVQEHRGFAALRMRMLRGRNPTQIITILLSGIFQETESLRVSRRACDSDYATESLRMLLVL